MFILSSIGQLATALTLTRTRRRTERALSTLPLELQKDIGWPDTRNERGCVSAGPCAK